MNHITIIAGARPNFMKVVLLLFMKSKKKRLKELISITLWFIPVSIMIRRCQEIL